MYPQVIKGVVAEALPDTWGWGLRCGVIILDWGIRKRYKDSVLKSCGQQWMLTRSLLSKGIAMECSRVSSDARLPAATALG